MLGGTFLIWAFAVLTGAWLLGLVLVIAFAIVGGRISLRGLLTEPLTGQKAFVSRPQLLLVALSAATTFIVAGMAAVGTTNRFPEVPTTMLAIVGGSHLVFLGGRGIAALLSTYLPLGGRP